VRRLITALLFLAASASAQTTPNADSVARRALDVMAGPAWEKARYLAFTFNVEREGRIAASYAQAWDRFTGDYRVSGKKPEDLIAAFRNSYNPRIAVTVDMIATGTDIKPLEVLLFLRDVRSRVYFEQMKGRGTRVLTPSEM